MKQVLNAQRKRSMDKQRLAVLRLEMNYELAVLFEAIEEKDDAMKEKSKRKLERIREELIRLKAL